jgi:3-deoxy-D-manno-octulosonate 8-phosphate phosphatase (KDO 8-P phosphatase)
MIENDLFKNINLLLMDVDGVLTNGSIIYHESGEQTKVFNSKDGLGLHLLIREGFQVGIVTARKSMALRHRCENLGIDLLFEGVFDKASTLGQIAEKTGIPPEQTAFMGDDLLDLPMFRRVALGIAVADAHERVLAEADLITRAKGGAGAVREVCDAILKSKGLWDRIIEELLPQL